MASFDESVAFLTAHCQTFMNYGYTPVFFDYLRNDKQIWLNDWLEYRLKGNTEENRNQTKRLL